MCTFRFTMKEKFDKIYVKELYYIIKQQNYLYTYRLRRSLSLSLTGCV